MNLDRIARSLGTLGIGNHFIELDQDEERDLYVVIHSGSRHLGTEVMNYYMTDGRKALKAQGKEAPYELVYLEGNLLEDYLHDMAVVCGFAQLNRDAILDELVKGMQWKVLETVSRAHNYIDSGESGLKNHRPRQTIKSPVTAYRFTRFTSRFTVSISGLSGSIMLSASDPRLCPYAGLRFWTRINAYNHPTALSQVTEHLKSI